ncbi:MAG: carboxypeptidase-like regulatory domain-containing protein [Bacteroidota bacterium]
MKRLVLFLLVINFFHVSNSQTVRGTILDNSDHTKISFASIYINGTSAGTNSDQNGYFELDITKYSSLPLTISALGYYSVTLTDFSGDEPIKIYLTQKTFELNEVFVVAKSTAKERKANLKLFKDQFLGSGYNGQNCVIMNEGDITLKNGTSRDTLRAFASKPILIINNALGYKITYYLDKFEYYRKSKSFLYKGSAIFDENITSEIIQKKFFEKRRKIAYLGSRSHFFSSLWTNFLKSNGFIVRNSIDVVINYEDIVIVRAGFKKYLSYKGNLYIYYLSKSPNSYIEPLKDQIFFDSNGYFDGSGIKVMGRMAQQRIGDLLPYDYRLK